MEKIRKISQIIFLSLFIVYSVKSQVKVRKSNAPVMNSVMEEEACSCNNILGKMVDESPLGMVNEISMSDLLNKEFLPLYNELATKNSVPLFPSKKINFLKSDCFGSGAFAKKCKKGNDDVYLIVYDGDFIKQIDDNEGLDVFFVLCHELGHIISDNYHNVFPIDVGHNIFKKSVQRDYKQNIDPKNPTKIMTIPEKHQEELTADTYAIWFLRKYIEKYSDPRNKKILPANFTLGELKTIFSRLGKKIPNLCSYSPSHPSCQQRNNFAQSLFKDKKWQEIQGSDAKLKRFATEEYDSTLINLDEVEYNLDIERIIQKSKGDSLVSIGYRRFNEHKFEESRKNYLDATKIYSQYYYPQDSAEVAVKLQELNKILSVQSFSYLSVLGSSDFTKFNLQADGQPVNATDAVIGHFGLRFGRSSYENPLGFEIDANYDSHSWQFDTFNQDRKAIERFQVKTISIQPKVSYRFVDFKKNNKTQGLVFSLGASWSNPLKLTYQNFQSSNQDFGLKLKPSWGVTAGFGFENIHRKLTGNVGKLWRVSVVGTYQPLQFSSPQLSNQNFSASAWSLGLSACVGIFPKFLTKHKTLQ
jgi:hypothetical protein